ncbi:MAG: nucleoside phosphorylase [Candidatus Woesearchaeota archaeon]
MKEAYITPEEYVKYARSKKGSIPKKLIIIYYEYLLDFFKEKYKPKELNLGRFATVYEYENVGVVLMTGIGSPHATTAMEEMIALGTKEFINIGSAGGLEKKGSFLCTKAVRDEGVSHHYLPHELFAYPDEELTKKLEVELIKSNIKFEKGATWTIDTPYRETKDEIKHYRNLGVKTVEMETAAIFSVGKYRGVKCAAAFHVSDLLVEEYEPMFEEIDVKESLRKLLICAIAALNKK